MSISEINKLALDLVARDFSDGHTPNNGGPTKTSRALAIIHLAARDAYAMVAGGLTPMLTGLPAKPATLGATDPLGVDAAMGAGIRAATLLYPDFASFIGARSAAIVAGSDALALLYGCEIADKWVASRLDDGSNVPQMDQMYSKTRGRHRPDPVTGTPTLGRTWGQCKPFILTSVAAGAPLGPPPPLNSQDYADAFDQVFVHGRDNIVNLGPSHVNEALIGLFWAYDGANKIGTPPRLYNQVVTATAEFGAMSNKDKVNALAAINAAMADAGIAAWYWKYVYDFWRPIVGIREAEAGFGPGGLGDGNTLRKRKGDPFWLPLGAPHSNPIPSATPMTAAAAENFTPNFPAYPSGHATFGTACFKTFAALAGTTPAGITVTFVSDELNASRMDAMGMPREPTTDNRGVVRTHWSQTFTLRQAIEQNKESRVWLGVHWIFDATGGVTLGSEVAVKAIAAFT